MCPINLHTIFPDGTIISSGAWILTCDLELDMTNIINDIYGSEYSRYGVSLPIYMLTSCAAIFASIGIYIDERDADNI